MTDESQLQILDDRYQITAYKMEMLGCLRIRLKGIEIMRSYQTTLEGVEHDGMRQSYLSKRHRTNTLFLPWLFQDTLCQLMVQSRSKPFSTQMNSCWQRKKVWVSMTGTPTLDTLYTTG